MLDKIYVTIRADKSSGLPAYDDYTFEYIPKFKEAGFVLIKVNNNFSHPDIGVNLRYWVELYHRTSYHYVNQMLLTLYSINWDGNQVFGEKAITPHKTFGAAEYYIERHNVYQYESKMQPLNEYIDDIVTQVNKLPTSSKLHFNCLDKDYGKFFHLFVGGINETDDEIIRTGDYASVHFEYNSNKFCGNEVIKNDNAFFNLSGFVSENDTVGGDDNVEYHFDSFDVLFKDNINFKELKFVIRYYSQNNYHSRSTNEPTIRSFTAYQYDSYTAPYVLAAICEPACIAARMFNRTKEVHDLLYKNYFTQSNNKKIDSFVNCRLTRIRGENEASAFLLYNGEDFILADVPSKSITGMRSLFLGNNDSVPMYIGTHNNLEKLLALGSTHQTGDRYSFTIDYLDSDGAPQIKYTNLEKSYDPSDERRGTEGEIAHYINYQQFAYQQYAEHGLNIFTIHNSVPPYKYYLNTNFNLTKTMTNLLKEKQIKPIINTMDFIIDVGNKDLFSNLYLNTTPLVQLPVHWKGTKDMIYVCDEDGNLVDPKVIFHSKENTASVSGEEASKPERSKEIVTYEFTPKETLTQICFHLPQEKDMFTAERSHVSYYVVDEIVHTEGDENLCAQFNSGFTEIVKSFERDKTDNEQINDAIRTYCSSDLLPETFSIGHAYIVKREVTYYKYFAPDTITTLAELKVQYEKHKEYINSPECNPKPKETSYFIAVPYAVTSNHDVSCYTIPLNSAVLEYHIKTSSIYVNSKYAEYETAYNKIRNNNIRWKLNNPTSDFEIILEDLNLKDAIINNFQRWLTNTKQDSTPKVYITSRVLNEAAFRISRFTNRIKYGQDSNFKNFLCASDIPIVSSSGTSLDYGVVPKFEMSVKDIQNGDEVSIIKQIQKYYNGDELLFSWKWDTAVQLSYLNSVATYKDGNYISKGYYNIEIINVKEKTYMMQMINPFIREICNNLTIGAFNYGIYYETTRDTPNQPTSTSFISALDGVYIRFMDKAFQAYINEDTTKVVLYSKTLNDYIPAHVVFDGMINSCPELVKYFNSQEKLMTSTNPYSDLKWDDIVPWVRDSIFKTTIDGPEKKTIEKLENPNFIVDTEIKYDDLTRAFMAPLLMGNTATEQIANKVLEDKLTLGNKMYSANIVKGNMLQKCNSDYNGGEKVTEENYFIKVEYALKENNPFGAISAKEMFALVDIAAMQFTSILLSDYIEYTKTHNEKIVKIKDGTIQSRLDNTPHQLYMHKDTQEMYVENGEFSFLPAALFFAEKEEKIMDKQDNDNIDQYNIECEQGEHGVHFAMDNNLSPERWDARDYHINHAQGVASIADFKEWKKSHEIHLKNLLKDFNQQFNSKQVKQTTINNIMIGM